MAAALEMAAEIVSPEWASMLYQLCWPTVIALRLGAGALSRDTTDANGVSDSVAAPLMLALFVKVSV